MGIVKLTNEKLFELKECHPRCVYQIYNRLIINNDSQKHNYICKYNNLPTTCSSDAVFQPEDGRIRPKHVVGKLLYLQI